MIPSPNCTRLLITCDDATRAEKSRLVETMYSADAPPEVRAAPTTAFLMPGYAKIGMTKQQGGRLVERFLKGDYGMATPSEAAGNIEAKKNGGEMIGRYFLNDERWILCGMVAATGGDYDMSPGCILHEKEYRDSWHKWQPGDADLEPAADHPTKVLFDTTGDPDVTIFPGATGPTKVDVKNLRKQNVQIRIGRTPGGELVLNLKTEGADYWWPLGVAQQLADGLRACADGDPLPAVGGGYVFAAKGKTLVAITDKPVRIGYVRAGIEIEADMSFTQRPQAARELADGIEEALRELPA